MKTEKKYIVAAGLGIISIAAAAAYLQYKKLMNYSIGFKSLNIKRVQANIADFDLILNFTNKSDVKFEIESQVYDVYLNNKSISKAVNYASQTILPKSTSQISVNVKFNPESRIKYFKYGIEFKAYCFESRYEVESEIMAIQSKHPLRLYYYVEGFVKTD